MMILQGVRRQKPYIGVCYANDPNKRGYTTLAPALYLTTSLRCDFCGVMLVCCNEWSLSQSIKISFWSRYVKRGRGGVEQQGVAKKRLLVGRGSLKLRQERVVVLGGRGADEAECDWEVCREIGFRAQSLLSEKMVRWGGFSP